MYGLLKFIYAKKLDSYFLCISWRGRAGKLWKYVVEYPWERGAFYNMPKNKEDRKLKPSPRQQVSFLSKKHQEAEAELFGK